MGKESRLIALFFALCAVIILYFQINREEDLTPKNVTSSIVQDTVVEASEPERLYGIVIDSMNVIKNRIKRNQNLSTILSAFNISGVRIDEIAKKSKEVFDLRKLGANKLYTLILKPDSTSTPTHFIYEPNVFEYVVFELEDSGRVYLEERDVEIVQRAVSGVIYSSLYVDMLEHGSSAQLVNDLADVFGWQIDFFKIQKGDKYKVIYEEKLVDGKAVDVGVIIGAYFEHFGNDYFAVNFDQGFGVDFFDEEGNSLRKAFLRTPVEHSRITSRYSGNRFHPVQKRWKAHRGTDYAAPRGSPIRTTGDGIVVAAGFQKYNGRNVKVKHNGTYTTQYLHMSSIARGMKPGVKVKQGQTIGYVGSTGLATGNHVCYRFWKNGSQVDAMKVELPPSEPIVGEKLERYFHVRDSVLSRLDSVVILDSRAPILARIE